MGQPSARERDIKAADLFDYGFGQSAGWTAQTLETLPASNLAAPPDLRPYICDKRKPIPVDEGPGALTAGADGTATQLFGSATADTSNLAFAALGAANVRGRSLPPRAPLQPIAVWTGRSPAEGAAALAQAEQEAQASKEAARTAKIEAARQKREEAKAAQAAKAEAHKQAAAEKAAKARAAAVTAPKSKTAAKDKVPAAASAYTAAEAPKPAHKPAEKPAAKKAETKPAAKKTEAKPAAKKAKGKDDDA